MMRCRCALLVFLAGCQLPGAGPRPQPPTGPTAAGGECPTADNVYVASYFASEDAAAPAAHTGWVLPLFDQKVESVGGQPEFVELEPAEASARGVPAAPPSVWLTMMGQPPCKATIGPYYAAAIDGNPNVTYGVELTGCPAPPADQQEDAEAIAMVADQAPTGCQVMGPKPVAARLGTTDAQKHWQRPTKQTPLPPAIAAILPPHDCKPPGCETLWAFGQVDVGGGPVAWAGAVNWLTIPVGAAPETACDWKAETFAGFFVPGPDGRAVKVTEGQEHPLLLSAVLVDRGGAKVLVAEGSGEYATYHASGARLARHLVWLRLPAEAYAIDERIGPSCSDDAAPPPRPAR